MTEPSALNVYRDDQLVGTLFDETPLRFRYADRWLRSPNATSLTPAIPLDQLEHQGPPVHTFFENLLPEGELRAFLRVSQQATTVFGLLHAVGGDTASAFTLLPRNTIPGPPNYRPTIWEAIAQALQDPNATPLLAQNELLGRVSLAGAQDKLLLTLLPDGTPAIPLGTAPSTHILKPDITWLRHVWSSALNETFVMTLAATIGMDVAAVEYQPLVKGCLIRRYDRIDDGEGGLRRLHQLDLCQLNGTSSDGKYECDGGPSLAHCRLLLQEHDVPASDLKRLLEWLFFNLYVGNHDGHAKNLSILQLPDGSRRLAPLYDLMSTSLYPGVSPTFAFSIGGEMRVGVISANHLVTEAETLGFKPAYVLRVAGGMAASVLANLDLVHDRLMDAVAPGGERTLLERLRLHITSTTKKLATRWEL